MSRCRDYADVSGLQGKPSRIGFMGIPPSDTVIWIIAVSILIAIWGPLFARITEWKPLW